jgi:hypothetical protein
MMDNAIGKGRTMALRYEYGDKTIQEFVLLCNNGQLNLEPGFQRDSVWSLNDRRKLIHSVWQNYPVPSVFLYRRSDNGKLVYDVIDGKQRLESILMFQGSGGFRGERFNVRIKSDSNGTVEDWHWRSMQKRGHEHRMMGYKIQTVEVDGELADIIDLFVRINSTGKRLTGAERRHARYFTSSFLRNAERLARRCERYFISNHVLSLGQVSRMKHIELTCELLVSIHLNGPINKKKALDDVIGGNSIDGRSIQRCTHQFIHTLNRVKRIFPDLRTTRFRNSVDFYSLFLCVLELERSGAILTDGKRNRQAQQLLVWLSNGVDEVRQQVKKAQGARPDQQLFASYLLSVQGDTDSQSTRLRRGELLRNVLGGIFERKDNRRGFTIEQRRLIWHSDEKKKCANPNCPDPLLTWENFTIDHVKPHSRGGRSHRANAALLCRSCNSRKGNRW